MSQGFFGSDGELWFEIQIVAASGKGFFIPALFDTGFTDGWLAINRQDARCFGVAVYSWTSRDAIGTL